MGFCEAVNDFPDLIKLLMMLMSSLKEFSQKVNLYVQNLLKNKFVINSIKILLGILLLIYILYNVDFSPITQLKINIYFLLFVSFSLFSTLLILFLSAYKWKAILCKCFNYNLSLGKSFQITAMGKFFSLFTPSRIGDVFRAKYISDLGTLKSVSSVLMDKIIDGLALVALSFLALAYLGDRFNLIQLNFKVVLVILILGALTYFLFRKKIYLLKKKIFPDKFNKLVLIYSFLISVIGWILSMLEIYLAACALNIPINPVDTIFISLLMSFVQLIPITVAGIGLRELTAVYFLPLLGLSQPQSLLVVWLTMITLTIFPAVLGYLFYLSFKSSHKQPEELGSVPEDQQEQDSGKV